MDLTEARTFLSTHHRAVLATWRRDGRIQLSPIAVGVDAEGAPLSAAGRPPTRPKICAVMRAPRVYSSTAFTAPGYR